MSLRANARLRKIGWVTLAWSVFAGAAVGIMPAVLREHMGMDEIRASATFIAGAIAVVSLTLPLVRIMQRARRRDLDVRRRHDRPGGHGVPPGRGRPGRGRRRSSTASSCSRTAPPRPRSAARGPAIVEHEHQGLLNLAVGTVGLVGFLGGVVLAAGLLGPLGFGAVLALVGAGMALTAVGFRRSLAAAT